VRWPGPQHPHHPTWGTTSDVGYVDEDEFLFLTKPQGIHDHV
jgi:hypothetical protein